MPITHQGSFKPGRTRITRAFAKPAIQTFGVLKQPDQVIVHKVVRSRSRKVAK